MNKKMILPLLTVFLFSSCHKAENETLFTESIPDTESIARTTTAESSISVSEPSETVTIAVNENASLEEQIADTLYFMASNENNPIHIGNYSLIRILDVNDDLIPEIEVFDAAGSAADFVDFYNLEGKNIGSFGIPSMKIEYNLVEKNNQKTSNLTTQTTDDAVKIDTQNLDEGFNLDAIADLDENAKNEQVTEDDKFLIDANGNVYERVDIQETKGENTSNAFAVETLKQSLPNSILEKINDKLGDVDINSADYNEKFIEAAFQIMGESGYLEGKTLSDLGLEGPIWEEKLKNAQKLINSSASNATAGANNTNKAKSTSGGASSTSGASASSGTSGAASSSGVSASGGSSSANAVKNAATTKQAGGLSSMSIEELNSELSSAESTLTTQQQELANAVSGNSPEIQAQEQVVQDEFNAYAAKLEEVNVELANQFREIETNLAQKEQQIAEKGQEITNQNVVISNCETKYENAKMTTESLKSQKSSLESQLSAIGSLTGDEEQDAQIESLRSSLESQISAISQEIAQAEQAEQAALEDLNNQKELLAKMEEEKTQLDAELVEIQQQKTEFEAKLQTENQALYEEKASYDNAKAELQNVKSTAISNAQSAISETQNRINEINTAITQKQNEEKREEYATSTKAAYSDAIGGKLAELAGKAKEVAGDSIDTVLEVLNKGFDYLETNVMPQALSTAADVVEFIKNNAPEAAEFAKHFIQDTTVKFDELANLPAGSVVIWEQDVGVGHISISLGNGSNLTDGIPENLKLEGKFTVYYPFA